MNLNPISVKAELIKGKMYLEIPEPVTQLLGISEGDIISYIPEKWGDGVSSSNENRVPRQYAQISTELNEKTELLKRFPLSHYKRGRAEYYFEGKVVLYIKYSKRHMRGPDFFFGVQYEIIRELLRKDKKGEIKAYIVFIAGAKDNTYVFPIKTFYEWIQHVERARDNNWKINMFDDQTLRTSGENGVRVSVAQYLNDFDEIEELLGVKND